MSNTTERHFSVIMLNITQVIQRHHVIEEQNLGTVQRVQSNSVTIFLYLFFKSHFEFRLSGELCYS